jgi:hypothetical protein
MTAPDLTDQRHHAEAVAYGKLLAVREILDALSKARPDERLGGDPRLLAGYDVAVKIIKAFRIGVEK